MIRPFLAALVPSLVAYALTKIDVAPLVVFIVIATIVGTVFKKGPLAQALLIFAINAGMWLAFIGVALAGAGNVVVIGNDFYTVLLLIVLTYLALSLGYAAVYKLLGKWF
ncbi:hypothetical protein [Pyrobaculum sp.]|uniref:hypothetical protein n=1 Tax=Pyrobaculum sp. TaxID=2004705 RepID=UPI0031636390